MRASTTVASAPVPVEKAAARPDAAGRTRILVLTSTFPRWHGDTEPRFVLDLCRHLAAGADVLVLAPHTAGAALEEELEGVRVRRFRYFAPRWQSVAYGGGILARLRQNPLRILQLPFFLAGLALAARRAIRDWSPSVVHAHWIIPQGLVACAVAGSELPILCTSHGGDLHGLRGPVLRGLMAWTLRRCRVTTVVSDSMVAKAETLAPGCAVKVIPMGTDLRHAFVPPADRAPRDRNHILFVGRLVEKKGLSYLLQAFAALKTTVPQLELTVAGDGPLRAPLQALAAQLGIGADVTFLGGVRHDELPALYQHATLAVFPFVVADDGDQEGFGLVVVEAMGCGCPVVASDLPAVRQTVEHEVTGLLIPPRDAGALAAAIGDMLGDSERRRTLAAAALAAARERFDWTSIAARYRETIDEVAHP